MSFFIKNIQGNETEENNMTTEKELQLEALGSSGVRR